MKKIIAIQKFILFATTCLVLTTISCNKQKKPVVNSAPPLVAPCDLPEDQFLYTGIDKDTLFYGNKCLISDTPDVAFENCHYYVRLKTTDPNQFIKLYFTKEPQTGIYTTPHVENVLDDDAIIGIRHETSSGIAFIPFPTDDPVYINNKNGKITISWCRLDVMLEFGLNITYQTAGKLTFKK